MATTTSGFTTVEIVKRFELDLVVQGFKICKEIAQSNVSNVYEVVDLKTQKRFAMKQLVANSAEYDSGMTNVIKNEAETCLKIGAHWSLVTVYPDDDGNYIRTGPGYRFMIMDLYDKDLDDCLEDTFENVVSVHHIIYAMTAAIAKLHESGTRHRDIKLGNVLVKTNKDNAVTRAVLADFGFATSDASSKTQIIPCRHLSDRAPETVNDGEYYLASDVYTLGQVIRRLIQGVSDRQPMPEEAEVEEPEEITALIEMMISHDYNERPTAYDCLTMLKETLMPEAITQCINHELMHSLDHRFRIYESRISSLELKMLEVKLSSKQRIHIQRPNDILDWGDMGVTDPIGFRDTMNEMMNYLINHERQTRIKNVRLLQRGFKHEIHQLEADSMYLVINHWAFANNNVEITFERTDDQGQLIKDDFYYDSIHKFGTPDANELKDDPKKLFRLILAEVASQLEKHAEVCEEFELKSIILASELCFVSNEASADQEACDWNVFDDSPDFSEKRFRQIAKRTSGLDLDARNFMMINPCTAAHVAVAISDSENAGDDDFCETKMNVLLTGSGISISYKTEDGKFGFVDTSKFNIFGMFPELFTDLDHCADHSGRVLMFDDLFSFKYVTNLFESILLKFVEEETMLKDNSKTDDENYDEVESEFKRLNENGGEMIDLLRFIESAGAKLNDDGSTEMGFNKLQWHAALTQNYKELDKKFKVKMQRSDAKIFIATLREILRRSGMILAEVLAVCQESVFENADGFKITYGGKLADNYPNLFGKRLERHFQDLMLSKKKIVSLEKIESQVSLGAVHVAGGYTVEDDE